MNFCLIWEQSSIVDSWPSHCRFVAVVAVSLSILKPSHCRFVAVSLSILKPLPSVKGDVFNAELRPPLLDLHREPSGVAPTRNNKVITLVVGSKV